MFNKKKRLEHRNNLKVHQRRNGLKDVVHIYNGMLPSHKKEQNCVICRDVDGRGD